MIKTLEKDNLSFVKELLYPLLGSMDSTRNVYEDTQLCIRRMQLIWYTYTHIRKYMKLPSVYS